VFSLLKGRVVCLALSCWLEKSVQVKDAPVIAIKTSVVDDHIEHNKVTCFKITENLGYGLYYCDIINKALIINNKNKLKWKK